MRAVRQRSQEVPIGTNAVFFAWNRSIPGREAIGAARFDEFVKSATNLQQTGTIQSFDVVFLDTHGGDLNGFFLLKGDTATLDALVASTEWVTHMTRASFTSRGPARCAASPARP